MEAAKATKTSKTTVQRKARVPLAHGVGRRKSAVARVWLHRGKGAITVNGKELGQYFDTEITRLMVVIPLKVYPNSSSFDVMANVRGGGVCAQADAIKLGISRAIVSIHEEARPLLKEHGLLTVDSRLKERKKYGQKAARRKFQFVKR